MSIVYEHFWWGCEFKLHSGVRSKSSSVRGRVLFRHKDRVQFGVRSDSVSAQGQSLVWCEVGLLLMFGHVLFLTFLKWSTGEVQLRFHTRERVES